MDNIVQTEANRLTKKASDSVTWMALYNAARSDTDTAWSATWMVTWSATWEVNKNATLSATRNVTVDIIEEIILDDI